MNSKSLALTALCALGLVAQSQAQVPTAVTWTLNLTGNYALAKNVTRGDITTTTLTAGKEKITMYQIVTNLIAVVDPSIPSTARLVGLSDGISDPAFYLRYGDLYWPVTNYVQLMKVAEYRTGSTTSNGANGKYSERTTHTYQINMVIDKEPTVAFGTSSFYIALSGTATERQTFSTALDGAIVGTVSVTVSGLSGQAVIGTGDPNNPYFVDFVNGTVSGSGKAQ